MDGDFSLFLKASRVVSGTRQPIHAYFSGPAVGPELDELLNREHASQILHAATNEWMTAMIRNAGINRLPGNMSLADDIGINAGLEASSRTATRTVAGRSG
jgi:hypothetical protein